MFKYLLISNLKLISLRYLKKRIFFIRKYFMNELIRLIWNSFDHNLLKREERTEDKQ